MSNKGISLSWSGKGLRLIDLLDQSELSSIINTFGNPQQFKALHVVGDGTEFAKYAVRNGLLEESSVMKRTSWQKSLQVIGYTISKGMDGRRCVTKIGDPVPVNGTVAPGAISTEEMAMKFLKGLAAEGSRLPPNYTYEPLAKPFVSKDFGEFLRANGEPVLSFVSNEKGDSGFIWPAVNEKRVNQMLAQYQLTVLGANEPDGGQIASYAQGKVPYQTAAWKMGMADEWRMMQSMRDNLCYCLAEMSTGAFAHAHAGGAMNNAFSAFQETYQLLASNVVDGVVTPELSDRFRDCAKHLLRAKTYFENADVQEPAVLGNGNGAMTAMSVVDRGLDNAIDLGIVIAARLDEHVQKYERRAERVAGQMISEAAGFS